MRIGATLLGLLRHKKSNSAGADLGADKMDLISKAFDHNYYLSQYADVAQSDMEPLDHFLVFGWREGRNPSAWFSTAGYLQANADVATSGVNPLIHYVLWGKAEGRAAAPEREFGTPWIDDMVAYPERPVSPPCDDFDPRRLHIHWVIADFSPGAGGHMTIFRMIHWLETFGHVCKLWISRPSMHKDTRHARADIARLFMPLRAQIGFLSQGFFESEGDAVFATSWETVWPVTHVTGFKERYYFVQDYEPRFYPAGALSIAAEASYTRDLACICAGPWLRQIMETEYNRWAKSFWLAYDHDVYKVGNGSRGGTVPRIAIYARQLTARRLVELVTSALTELVRRTVAFHADMFGNHSDVSPPNFSCTFHGVLGETQLAELYNDCDIGICLSATNYSLVDVEMMACGLPIIEYGGDNTRAVFPEGVATFAGPDPASLANAIERLLNDPVARQAQAKRALKWVSRFNWEKSARTVEKSIVSRLKGRHRWRISDTQPSTATPCRIKDGPHGAADSLGHIVFVGQPEYFRSAYYDGLRDGLHFEFAIGSANPARRLQTLPEFVHRAGAKTCIVFRPEWLADVDGLTEELCMHGVRVIGISTEPVPTGKAPPHPDQTHRLESLRRALALPLDLIVHYDPSSEDFLRDLGCDRLICQPLPVSPQLFYPEQTPIEFDACFLGRSTAHREHLLGALKRETKIVHVAHGLVDEQARGLMNRSRVVLNLHCEPYIAFETRAIQALRCGRPLISERLSGSWLKAGVHYELADTPEKFLACTRKFETDPPTPAATPDFSAFDLETFLTKISEQV